MSHLWGRGRGTASGFSRGLPDPWSHVLYDLQNVRIQVLYIPNQGLAIGQDQALIWEQNEASAYDQGQCSVCDQNKDSVCILGYFFQCCDKIPRDRDCSHSEFMVHSSSW